MSRKSRFKSSQCLFHQALVGVDLAHPITDFEATESAEMGVDSEALADIDTWATRSTGLNARAGVSDISVMDIDFLLATNSSIETWLKPRQTGRQ